MPIIKVLYGKLAFNTVQVDSFGLATHFARLQCMKVTTVKSSEGPIHTPSSAPESPPAGANKVKFLTAKFERLIRLADESGMQTFNMVFSDKKLYTTAISLTNRNFFAATANHKLIHCALFDIINNRQWLMAADSVL